MPEDFDKAAPPSKRGFRGVPWLSVALLVFILYLLSTGPAFRLNRTDFLPDAALNVYAPVVFVATRCKPVGRLFCFWVDDIWGGERHAFD